MLLFSSLVATVVLNLCFCTAADSSQDNGRIRKSSRDAHTVFNSLTTLLKSNHTTQPVFLDRSDNMLVLPSNIKKHINTPKRRSIKKSPKRTIQKIIKKAKKSRKTFLNQITSTTEPTEKIEEMITIATTEATLKKKVRKWNSRHNRNQLIPFQRKENALHHRIKRQTQDGRDIFILQDLDEIEFLSNEKGTNAIKAHVKKYW